MQKLHEREMLNLILPGGIVERFAVTKSSWQNFLEKLSEKDLTNQSASTYIPSEEGHGTHGTV
jgi:hypothetical protein